MSALIHPSETIARAFAAGLLNGCSFTEDGVVHELDGLGLDTMRDIVAENAAQAAAGNLNTCETHSFVDANMYMLAAMQGEGFMLDGAAWHESDDLAGLWNDAWTLAKSAGFYLEA